MVNDEGDRGDPAIERVLTFIQEGRRAIREDLFIQCLDHLIVQELLEQSDYIRKEIGGLAFWQKTEQALAILDEFVPAYRRPNNDGAEVHDKCGLITDASSPQDALVDSFKKSPKIRNGHNQSAIGM
jgi:hypothetical protein